MTLLKAALLTGSSKPSSPRRETLRCQLARGFKQRKESVEQNKLVLASGSPRRIALLGQVGIDPVAFYPASICETPKRYEMPRVLAHRLARTKAEVVRGKILDDADLADSYIMSADTVVSLGRRVFSKPALIEEAVASLRMLSGRSHKVITAVCLITPDDRVRIRSIETRVYFRRLSRRDIEAYIATREWFGKSGGYAIQGVAGCFVQKIVGSYSNVVGLPLVETMALMMGEGFKIHTGWAAAAELDA